MQRDPRIRIAICPSCGAAWPLTADRVVEPEFPARDDEPLDLGWDEWEDEPLAAAPEHDERRWRAVATTRDDEGLWRSVATARERELYRRRDHAGLIRHLEAALAAHPEDDGVLLRLAEACLRDGAPARVLALLEPLHRRRPDALDAQLLILDALLDLGREADDFPWRERMPVIRLERETLDACARYLARRRTPCPLAELYALGPPYGYLWFGPEEFATAVVADPRFDVGQAVPGDVRGPRVRLARPALRGDVAGDPDDAADGGTSRRG